MKLKRPKNIKLTAFISSACALVIALTVIFTGGTTASATEYNETDPELTFYVMNSQAEKIVSNVSLYDCIGTFEQSGGTYKMNTDAYTAWMTEDEIAYAYRTYNIGATRQDVLTLETTVTERSFPGNSYTTASVGLMVRQSLDPSSPELFLHCRDSIAVVYRSQQGGGTIVKYSGVAPKYPVQLKIEKVGTQYTCYYKNNGMTQYAKIATLGCNIQGPVLGGLAAHACMGKGQTITGGFKGFSAVGQGSFDGSGSDGTTPSEPEETGPEWEDAPVADDVLLSETFTDGSITDGKEAVTNPIWSKFDGEITVEDSGNRIWTKNFVSSHSYAGDQEWTDYSASVDFRFTENCDFEQSNIMALHIRHREISYLGMYDYTVTLHSHMDGETPVRELRIYRRYRIRDGYANGILVASAPADDYLLKPGVWQNIYVEAMDNNIKVWLNGEQKIDYTDDNTTIANLKGCIGISTYDTDVAIDNIVVRKLNDELGGDYDNDIGGNYNEEVPAYLKEWSEKGKTY